MRGFLSFLFILTLPFGKFYSYSLWKNGNSFYKINLKSGDILTVKFSDKVILKYKIEQKNTTYLDKKGKKGEGELFNFFPDIAIKENDTAKDQLSLSLNSENKFSLKAKIVSLDDNVGVLNGYNSVLIGGELYKLDFAGEFDIYSVSPDNSILSTDLYNLNFKITKESSSTLEFLSEEDLVFKTNFSEIFTNYIYDPTNSVTNTVLMTNLSSFEIRLKGISEEKKKELILNYLRSIINQLFF